MGRIGAGKEVWVTRSKIYALSSGAFPKCVPHGSVGIEVDTKRYYRFDGDSGVWMLLGTVEWSNADPLAPRAFIGTNCPNCGAPYLGGERCEYCGTYYDKEG